MNEYYHEFTPGFNWWYIIVVFFCVLEVLEAFITYRIVIPRSQEKKPYLKQDYSFVLQGGTGIIGTAMFLIFAIPESWVGVLQILDNSLSANDSGVWSFLLIVPTYLLAAIAVMAIYLFVGQIASCFICGVKTKIVKNPEYIKIIQKNRKERSRKRREREAIKAQRQKERLLSLSNR